MPPQNRKTSLSRALPQPSSTVAPAVRHRTRGKARPKEPVSSEPRQRRFADQKPSQWYGASPATLVAVMLGIATAMVIVGLIAKLRAVFVDTGDLALANPLPAGSIVAGAALLALAVGVRVPHRFAVSVCATAWRRFVRKGTTSDLAGALIHHDAPDRALYWLVLAVIALVAGVAIALLPISLLGVISFYDWMQAHFLWSNTSLILLQTITSFAAGVIPLAVLGLLISCVHHLCCRFAQWEVAATSWVLVGAALGTLLASQAIGTVLAADPFMIAASLPVLLVSIAAAFLGASRGQSNLGSVEPSPVTLPQWSDRWPRLLRAGIVAVGGGSAFLMFVYVDHSAQNPDGNGIGPATLLFALAVGLLGGARMNHRGLRSIGGFGTTCNVAGVIVAIGAVAHSAWSGAGVAPFILSCAGVAGIGFATAYGRQALLIRVASRSSEGAVELGRLLISGGLTLLVGAPLAVLFFGPTAALIMLAVSLVALGGTLVIHDPLGSPLSRRIRLGALFVSISAMLLLSRMVGGE